jgi:hypothetical protein
MAKFDMQLPKDVMSDLKKIDSNAEKIFGDMTRAGAEVALNEVRSNAPSNLKPYAKLTKTYKTPSDGGINTKVFFSGYLPFSTPNRTSFLRRGRGGGKVYSTTKGVPADFLAILYEYGRSNAPFPKKPFFRRSFNQGRIEKAMLEAQKTASGGILE